MKKHSRGFTLIELLVVVAIIGILSTIVLAALGQARQRARQTSAKATISQIRAQAELDQDFDNVCTQTPSKSPSSILIDDAVRQGGYDRSKDISCNDSTSGYAIWLDADQNSSFLDLEDFCIDSTGFAGQPTTAPGGNQITCR